MDYLLSGLPTGIDRTDDQRLACRHVTGDEHVIHICHLVSIRSNVSAFIQFYAHITYQLAVSGAPESHCEQDDIGVQLKFSTRSLLLRTPLHRAPDTGVR